MTEHLNPELELFRNQWREEVTKRSKAASTIGDKKEKNSSRPQQLATSISRLSQPKVPSSATFKAREEEEEDGYNAEGYYGLEDKGESRCLGEENTADIYRINSSEKEPRSALEHFERAVEKEGQGNLGDSLSHYRQAYRVCGSALQFILLGS